MFKILFWNECGGFTSKIDTLTLILSKHNPVALFIAEAEIKPNLKLEWFQMQGYRNMTSKTAIRGNARLVAYLRKDQPIIMLGKIITDNTAQWSQSCNNLQTIQNNWWNFKRSPRETHSTSYPT